MSPDIDLRPARLGRVLHGVLQCPSCANEDLEAVTDGDLTNFLCRACWTCWHWNLGYLRRVPPRSCAGCQHQVECLRRASHVEVVVGS